MEQANMGAISLLQTMDMQGPDANPIMKLVYVGSLVCICGLVTGIFFNRGVMVIAGIMAYLVSLSTMTITVKGVFVNQKFTFPKFVTGIHFLSCGLLCFGIMYYKHVNGFRKFVVPTMK